MVLRVALATILLAATGFGCAHAMRSPGSAPPSAPIAASPVVPPAAAPTPVNPPKEILPDDDDEQDEAITQRAKMFGYKVQSVTRPNGEAANIIWY